MRSCEANRPDAGTGLAATCWAAVSSGEFVAWPVTKNPNRDDGVEKVMIARGLPDSSAQTAHGRPGPPATGEAASQYTAEHLPASAFASTAAAPMQIEHRSMVARRSARVRLHS